MTDSAQRALSDAVNRLMERHIDAAEDRMYGKPRCFGCGRFVPKGETHCLDCDELPESGHG